MNECRIEGCKNSAKILRNGKYSQLCDMHWKEVVKRVQEMIYEFNKKKGGD